MEIWVNKSLSDIPDETWADISGFEDCYQVSNLGRVKSLSRVVEHATSKTKTIPERIISIKPDSQGYLIAQLWKNNKVIHCLVHRLVAKSFIPNPSNLPEVNHKFGFKWDNRVSELEWITPSDNQRHSFSVLKRKSSTYGRTGSNSPFAKKIKCETFDMKFDSLKDASIILGINQSAISMVLLNIRKHAAGMVFSYIK